VVATSPGLTIHPDNNRWEIEMTSRILMIAAAAAALTLGTAAQAQQWQQHQWRGEAQAPHQEQQWRGQTQVQRQGTYQQRDWSQRQQWQAPAQAQHYSQRWTAPQYQQRAYNNYAPRYYAQHRAYGGYAPRYYSGGYYTGQRYWINDWQSRRLYAPPYGYSWVQSDTGDVLLIALATGLIANVILSQ
jgi:Ni/Co efflux regulator RcnB